jgi:hypothetical protein
MPTTKPEFLESFFEQIESQIQFGDSKASLLVAGDAILLAVSGGLITMVSGCHGDEFTVSCMVPSVSLGFATTTAALLTLSLTFALLAARPAKIHDRPPPDLFLLSHVAHTDRDAFAKKYIDSSPEDLILAALSSIHAKAVFATRKFRLLKRAIDATLLSLGFMVATLIVAVGDRIFP